VQSPINRLETPRVRLGAQAPWGGSPG